MNKIVVHTKNGVILKGRTSDFSQRKDIFHLTVLESSEVAQEISVNDLKAIFFVNDFRGNSLHVESKDFTQAPLHGKHVIVSFSDGELFYGVSETIHKNRIGFFVSPLDPEANTIRAFVINSFIKNIELVN